MKKILSLLLVLSMVLSLAACSKQQPTTPDEPQGETEVQETVAEGTGLVKHKIGALVYSITDDQVISFRRYLEDYIASCFEEVEFVYSQTITTPEQEMEYINQFAEAGVEGVLAFNSYDMKAEVELCAEKGMYYMRPAASVSDAEFAAVADNPYFVGVVGPGSEMEYQCGAEMAEFFVKQNYGNEYFILSGGMPMHIEMHTQRTMGILDTLQKAYGVTFDQADLDAAANSMEAVHMEAGDLKVCVCPGFMDSEAFLAPAQAEFQEDQYQNVLSVIPVDEMVTVIQPTGAKIGVIDNYSERNLQLFNEGVEVYCVGKYNSIIGPAFAAMYNAITGNGDKFREDGKAFSVIQGFWTSDSKEDYAEKYALSAGIALNAYNYQDLENVMTVYNADANLDDLKALAGAYTFADALKRRAE